MAMVSPPPRVSSGFMVPPIASARRAGHREPEPDAGGAAGFAESPKGHEHPVPVSLGDARPSVGHTQLNPDTVGAGGQLRR